MTFRRTTITWVEKLGNGLIRPVYANDFMGFPGVVKVCPACHAVNLFLEDVKEQCQCGVESLPEPDVVVS